MSRPLLAVALAVIALAPVAGRTQNYSNFGNVQAITADRLRAHLQFVASDLLEGRNTPSRGLDIATLYVATQLKLWGVEPGGENGTYFQTVPLKEFSRRPEMADATARNVVGIIRGTDPKLKDEFIAISAHIDHVGMRTANAQDAAPADVIYNGADDDGSGTVSILEIAHAFATGKRPKRSMIFIWHIGEERGLWGSAYFTKNPTVPITSIVANLNIDMIGRSRPEGDTNPRNKMLTGPNAIYVIGSNKLSTDLGKTVAAVNKDLYNLTLDYHYDAPNDPEQLYYRSDHFNYAQRGIPIAFFFDGVHEDYHGLKDEWDRIDYRKMERTARTVMGIAWSLGSAKARPRIDGKPEN